MTERRGLPRRGGERFVTDGGLETDLIFHHGVELPEFAAFPLLDDEAGQQLLANYYGAYAGIATRGGAKLLLETPSWRANPDWGARVGYDRASLQRNNELSVTFLRELGERYLEDGLDGYLVSAMIGPRGDGYAVGTGVDPEEAFGYHHDQVAALAAAGTDLVAGYTMTDPGEAIGIVLAARAEKVPVAIAFTVETDGRLPGGMSVTDAINRVDTTAAPDYFLLNCANPAHMLAGVPGPDDAAGWQAWNRIIGIRANASLQSHAELDEAATLDDGDLAQLVEAAQRLAQLCGEFTILGGCCGTDSRHVAALWGNSGAQRLR